MKIVLVIAAALMALCGCSSYQLTSQNTRMTVDNISPKTFTVNFCGNAYMQQKEVEKYALQRASEVSLSKGYSHFVVLKKSDNSELCMLNSAGTSGAESSSRSTAPSSYVFQPFLKPNITLTIQCFSKGEKLMDGAIDAEQFLKENFPGLKQ